jgi:hypothetical protein
MSNYEDMWSWSDITIVAMIFTRFEYRVDGGNYRLLGYNEAICQHTVDHILLVRDLHGMMSTLPGQYISLDHIRTVTLPRSTLTFNS